MDRSSQNIQDEIKARRIVLVDGQNRPRIVLEVTGSDKEKSQVTLLDDRGRDVLTLEVDGRGEPRVRVGNSRSGLVAELEAGLLLLGRGGNTGVLAMAGEDGGVMHLCDVDGAPVQRLPDEE